jgi:hypothetical protein
MANITDMNIVGLDKSKMAANLGDSNEHIVAAILIRLGFDVAISAVHGTPYDVLIIAYAKPNGEKVMLRAQIKTASGSVSFIGGSRGGVDRVYKSGVKTYKYGIEHSDLILGIDKDTMDIFVIPTKFISAWGTSKATNKIQILRNNWDILLNWNNAYLDALQKQLP